MLKPMPVAIPNANFSSLAGKSVHEENQDLIYREYRRQWEENPKSFIVRDFPIHLDIEATNRCNLRCTFCDKLPLLSKNQKYQKYQMGDINLNLYKKIIDEGSEHKLWGVKLSYRGEPLLHHNLIDMIVYAKKKGILDIYFNTNAMLLSENMSCSLIGAELTRISISIEGTDPLAFEQERRGAKFDTIMFNIDKLIELREKKNCKHPKVRIQTVRLPNLDLNNYKKFWESHCDEVAVIDYKDAVNRDKTLINDYWACPQLWQRMTIEWNGAIMPCNNDDFRLLSSGNVENKSVFECWHNSIVQDARKMHQAGKSHLISACNGCPWRTTQIKKLLKK